MAIKTKEELKAYFENGKVPSQNHYVDLIDSIFSIVMSFPGPATNFLNALGQFASIAWSDISGKPTSFTPSAHSHSGSDISSGTISTDRFSAYSDLSAESKIGSGSGQVAAGNHAHASMYTFHPLTSNIALINGISVGTGNVNWHLPSYGLPSGIKAVQVLLGSRWTTVNAGYMRVFPYGSSDFQVNVNANTANVHAWCGGTVAVVSDYITIGVFNSATGISYVFITGYYV